MPVTLQQVGGSVNSSSPVAARAYDNSTRRARALETERRILTAAEELFGELGYVGTSLTAIADKAGVNSRTVYKVFGTKVRLLSRLVDVAMVGDQTDVAVMDRSWARAAFHAPTGRERIRHYAFAVRRLMDAAGSAFRTAAQAAAVDAEAEQLWSTGQRHRREDSTKFIKALAAADMMHPDYEHDDAIALVWLLTSPETHTQLTEDFGFTPDQYEHWLDATLTRTLLGR